MSSSKKVRLKLGKQNVRSPRRSPQSKNYSDFLEGKEKERRQTSPQRGDVRVVKVIREDKKDGKKDEKKEEKVISPPKQRVRVKTTPKAVTPKAEKTTPKVATPKVVTPKADKAKRVAKSEPPKKKKLIRRPSAKRPVSRNRRSSKRVATKQSLNKKYTKTRKVSLKCVPQNKEKDVDKVLESIKKMSDKSIKEKLSKNGIIINSNKKQLLRDMYVFSELGGIKIHKE